jgi:putative flippase GtrA
MRTLNKQFFSVIIQFVKYIFVGGIAFLFDFGTLYILTEYGGLHYLASAVVAFIIGLNVNYFLAKFLVFKDSKITNIKKEYFYVVCISLSALLLNQVLLFIFTDKLGIYYLNSKIITTIILLFYNFIIRKVFIFS